MMKNTDNRAFRIIVSVAIATGAMATGVALGAGAAAADTVSTSLSSSPGTTVPGAFNYDNTPWD